MRYVIENIGIIEHEKRKIPIFIIFSRFSFAQRFCCFFSVHLFEFSWDLDVSQTNMISCCSLLMWRKWRWWFDFIPMVAVNPIFMEIFSVKPLFVRLLQVLVRYERFIEIIVKWQIMFVNKWKQTTSLSNFNMLWDIQVASVSIWLTPITQRVMKLRNVIRL